VDVELSSLLCAPKSQGSRLQTKLLVSLVRVCHLTKLTSHFLYVIFRPPSPSTRSCTCRRLHCPSTSRRSARAASSTTPGSNTPLTSSSCSEATNRTSSTTSSPTCHTTPGRRGEGKALLLYAPLPLALGIPAAPGCAQRARRQLLLGKRGWMGWESPSEPPVDGAGCLVSGGEDHKS